MKEDGTVGSIEYEEAQEKDKDRWGKIDGLETIVTTAGYWGGVTTITDLFEPMSAPNRSRLA